MTMAASSEETGRDSQDADAWIKEQMRRGDGSSGRDGGDPPVVRATVTTSWLRRQIDKLRGRA